MTTSEDTPFSFTDSNLLRVTDVESDNVTVTLTAANGTLTAGGQSGSEIKLTGSPSEVSEQLAKLSFTPNENYNGPATIMVKTVETLTDKPLGADGIISITVDAVNDAPVLVFPKAVETSEDTPFSFTDSNLLRVTDVESDNVTVTLTAANG